MQKININIKKYITELVETRNKLNQVIDDNRKVLLKAPMGAGKTTWLFEDIEPYAKNQGMRLIVVNPSVAQLKQLEHEYKVYCVCEGRTYNDEDIVTSTPDSLPKIIKKLNGVPFILVVDEAHEIYTSVKFRKAFENIKKYEDMASKVIYMTATPKPLEFDPFDYVVNVIKKQTPIKTSVMVLDQLDVNVIARIAEDKLNQSEVVCIHNNNKKENKAIGEYFKDRLNETKQILLEEHQENMLGRKANIDNVTISKVSVLNAQSKDHKEYKNLVCNSSLLDDTSLFISTSFIKAGMNINNNKRTTILIVCSFSDFNQIDQIQTIGRYRNAEKIDEVIFLLKETKDLQGIQYKPFESIYEQDLHSFESLRDHLNSLTFTNSNDVNVSEVITYNEEEQVYEINMQKLIANSIKNWASSLLKFPNILKKELENESAINLKAKIVKYDESTCHTECHTIISDRLKENAKADKQRFNECLEQILTYDDLTLSEVIDYTVDQRRAENRHIIENMNILHELISQSWHKLYKQIIKELEPDKVKAFRMLATKKHTSIRKDIKASKVKEYNKLIKSMGLDKAIESELIYKACKDMKDFAMQIRIRKELLEIELKRSSISKVKIVALVNTLRELKYISDKTSEKKAYDNTIEMLEMIYNISTHKRGMTLKSVNY